MEVSWKCLPSYIQRTNLNCRLNWRISALRNIFIMIIWSFRQKKKGTNSYRSPTEIPFTSPPISLTTPANSCPKMTHFADGNSLARIWRSVPHTPENATLTRTSFGAETWGIGVVMTDSWPSQSCTAVFMLYCESSTNGSNGGESTSSDKKAGNYSTRVTLTRDLRVTKKSRKQRFSISSPFQSTNVTYKSFLYY